MTPNPWRYDSGTLRLKAKNAALAKSNKQLRTTLGFVLDCLKRHHTSRAGIRTLIKEAETILETIK